MGKAVLCGGEPYQSRPRASSAIDHINHSTVISLLILWPTILPDIPIL